MKSFRTEIENPVVENDIIELERKIREFKEGKLPSEKFRSLRLARGVYGQRQQGVQMIRIKLPFGKLTAKQLIRIADISDEYSNGKLHLTTRQDIQVHYVSLDKTPELWAKLEQDDITLREACGNTVRNITASAAAGIDPNEPFDVTPYAYALFRYFLRQPFDQDLPRKFKIAFSSSEEDTAFTFMHDLGFIPKVKINGNQLQRGFKVVVGGGLGAQPVLAQTAFEFLEEDRIIPFAEAAIRVFDRYGERNNRHKARLKYLLEKIGLEEFLALVREEQPALEHSSVAIDRETVTSPLPQPLGNFTTLKVSDNAHYLRWLHSNVFEQKQKDHFGVNIRVPLGNLSTSTARKLAGIVKKYAADDLRVTVNQGFLLRFVPQAALPALYRELDALLLAEAGAGSIADITACPGTDTCNLGISSSTGISSALEKVIGEEYPDLVYNHDIKIKISGCMNSCGQHSLAQIGFHGSSIKVEKGIVPALVVLLGGGATGNGHGRVSEKIIKVPSKRGPDVLRYLLNDLAANAVEGEYFNSYFDRRGKDYFYQLLKSLGDTTALSDTDFIDWGQEEKFSTAIGVGECAGVMIDLVATLIFEAEEKLDNALAALEGARYADSIYHSYAAFIHTAKALLLGKEINHSTHHGILGDFDKHFEGAFSPAKGFKETALQINKEEPSADFARTYFLQAKKFIDWANEYKQAVGNRQTGNKK